MSDKTNTTPGAPEPVQPVPEGTVERMLADAAAAGYAPVTEEDAQAMRAKLTEAWQVLTRHKLYARRLVLRCPELPQWEIVVEDFPNGDTGLHGWYPDGRPYEHGKVVLFDRWMDAVAWALTEYEHQTRGIKPTRKGAQQP